MDARGQREEKVDKVSLMLTPLISRQREEVKGYYFLYTDGDLVFKFSSGGMNSPFVRKVWKVDGKNPYTIWKVMLEALVMHCSIKRAKDFALWWDLTSYCLEEMVSHVVGEDMTPGMKEGIDVFIREVLEQNVETFWSDKRRRTMESRKRLIRLV